MTKKKICKECVHHIIAPGRKWLCGKHGTYEADEVTGENTWTGVQLCRVVRADADKCGPAAQWFVPIGVPNPSPTEWPFECATCPVKEMFDQQQTEGDPTP
jgi:hypothetical protein